MKLLNSSKAQKKNSRKVLDKVIESLSDLTTPEKTFRAVDQAVQKMIGHICISIFYIDQDKKSAVRIYCSKDTSLFPIGGMKDMSDHYWGEVVIENREVFLANTKECVKKIFPDYNNIFSIGCGANLSFPIIHKDEVIGAINILNAEGWFTAEHFESGREISKLLVPVMKSNPVKKLIINRI